MRHRRGLSIIDVLVAIGLVALIISIILPSINRMRERSGRQRCPSNLRQIGQAIYLYAKEKKGAFPRALFDGAGGPPTSYSGSSAANPFLAGGPGPNDVTAVLFLLVRTQDLTPDVFVCPNGWYAERWNFDGATAQQKSNFPSRRYLTYSYTNPYASPEVEKAGFKLSYSLTSDFALAADMNPGGAAVTAVSPSSPRAELAKANSPNHDGDGQNVLYADGHVEFQDTPFGGMMRNAGSTDPASRFRDNIYTHGATWGASAGVSGAPADPQDSVLLPTALDGPP